MNRKFNLEPIISSIVAIILGLIVGLIILIAANNEEAFSGFLMIVLGGIIHGNKGIGQVLYYATPLILCGLSVGFAFKTGLFNIGASGQFVMGTYASLVVGLLCGFLGPFEVIVGLIAGAIFGGLLGALTGALKAFYNVNEVISSILLNYVSVFFVNMAVKGNKLLFNPSRNESKDVLKSSILPKLGLDKIFVRSSVNCGIIIAIVIAIVLYIILEKTTFGYELKACGFNKVASKYAGINENKNIILSMFISGAVAGLAGAIVILSGSGRHISIQDIVPPEGFNGISVALLASSNPIGIIFSGLFIAYLMAGGFYLQLFSFSKEIIDIIVSVIIYASAFSIVVKKLIDRLKKENGGN